MHVPPTARVATLGLCALLALGCNGPKAEKGAITTVNDREFIARFEGDNRSLWSIRMNSGGPVPSDAKLSATLKNTGVGPLKLRRGPERPILEPGALMTIFSGPFSQADRIISELQFISERKVNVEVHYKFDDPTPTFSQAVLFLWRTQRD